MVRVRGVGKSYGGVRAIDGVDLDLHAGEVHALCGENGAGKSTLIKILAGSVMPDRGTIEINGQPLAPGSIAASTAAGIAVIYQESVAFPHLSAVDNIFAGQEPPRFGGLLLDRPAMRRRTIELMRQLGESIDIAAPVAELPLAQRQMVGIARALAQQCRLMILDEPTASLSARETRTLFRIVRQLQQQGVAIMYVSHRMEELFELGTRATVLRDGRCIETRLMSSWTTDALIKAMVGREVELVSRTPHESPAVTGEASLASSSQINDRGTGRDDASDAVRGDVKQHDFPSALLEVQDLTREPAFRHISLQVRAGEVVGLAGLVGAGRSEVARGIFGVDVVDGGSVRVAGELLRLGSIRSAIAAGIGFVPEDRQHLGLVLPLSVGTNLTLTVLNRLATGGWRSSRREHAVIDGLVRDLQVKTASASLPAESLSGGNQQKLVLGKWLATKPRILILDEPTRGVDVGAKAEVHRLIRRLADDGMATLMISSDLPEILTVSDRILVMRGGKLSAEFSAADATQEKILTAALPAEELVPA